MFDNVNLAIDWLINKRKKGKRENLNRIIELAKILDIYNLNFKIVHIAGTNGKGSTAYYINNALYSLGYKVGLFTSPYITKFNERIIINNTCISDENLLRLINLIKPIILDYEEKNADLVPFFEISFLIALLYFKEQKIDYAVIECGLGGLLDATNFITPIASIITSIGYDHQNTLGEDILDIARHKAGIIKDNSVCFTISNPKTNAYLEEVANSKNTKLFILDDISNKAKLDDKGISFIYNKNKYEISSTAFYQVNNACLMLAFMNYFFPNIEPEVLKKSLYLTKTPARFEKINNFIIDGAHNISAILELVKTLKKNKLNNLVCIYASLKDKDYPSNLNLLNEVVSKYIFPRFEDLRQLEPENYLNYIDNKEYIITNNIEEALKEAKDQLVLITGSLHFASSCRNILLNN